MGACGWCCVQRRRELRRHLAPRTSSHSRFASAGSGAASGPVSSDRASKAQAEQVRTIAVERLGPRSVGALDQTLLMELDNALRLHLAL